jgi:hypothetical protein
MVYSAAKPVRKDAKNEVIRVGFEPTRVATPAYS